MKASRRNNPYVGYYLNQRTFQRGYGGGGITVFSGRRFQAGSGLGSMFGKLFRTATPFLKKAGAYLGKKMFRTGVKVIGDVRQGQDMKSALKRRFKETGKQMLEESPEFLLKRAKNLIPRISKSFGFEEPDIFHNDGSP